jgi:hypothetical protein
MQPQSAIYNLKLGTHPKGGSPKDKSQIIQRLALRTRFSILNNLKPSKLFSTSWAHLLVMLPRNGEN